MRVLSAESGACRFGSSWVGLRMQKDERSAGCTGSDRYNDVACRKRMLFKLKASQGRGPGQMVLGVYARSSSSDQTQSAVWDSAMRSIATRFL